MLKYIRHLTLEPLPCTQVWTFVNNFLVARRTTVQQHDGDRSEGCEVKPCSEVQTEGPVTLDTTDSRDQRKPSQQSVRGSWRYFAWPLNYGENKPSSRHGGWGRSFKYCLQAWVATSVLADGVWSEISRYITYLFSRQKGQSSVSGSQHSFFFVTFFLLSSCVQCAIQRKEENILITWLLYILITFVI